MSLALQHLVILPIVLPLAAGALMLPLSERRHGLKAAISIAAALLLLAAALALAVRADEPVGYTYPLGDWPAPFGIVLVADRLALLMVLLTSVVVSLLFAPDHAGTPAHAEAVTLEEPSSAD